MSSTRLPHVFQRCFCCCWLLVWHATRTGILLTLLSHMFCNYKMQYCFSGNPNEQPPSPHALIGFWQSVHKYFEHFRIVAAGFLADLLKLILKNNQRFYFWLLRATKVGKWLQSKVLKPSGVYVFGKPICCFVNICALKIWSVLLAFHAALIGISVLVVLSSAEDCAEMSETA